MTWAGVGADMGRAVGSGRAGPKVGMEQLRPPAGPRAICPHPPPPQRRSSLCLLEGTGYELFSGSLQEPREEERSGTSFRPSVSEDPESRHLVWHWASTAWLGQWLEDTFLHRAPGCWTSE